MLTRPEEKDGFKLVKAEIRRGVHDSAFKTGDKESDDLNARIAPLTHFRYHLKRLREREVRERNAEDGTGSGMEDMPLEGEDEADMETSDVAVGKEHEMGEEEEEGDEEEEGEEGEEGEEEEEDGNEGEGEEEEEEGEEEDAKEGEEGDQGGKRSRKTRTGKARQAGKRSQLADSTARAGRGKTGKTGKGKKRVKQKRGRQRRTQIRDSPDARSDTERVKENPYQAIDDTLHVSIHYVDLLNMLG